jgi:hypothetical protein
MQYKGRGKVRVEKKMKCKNKKNRSEIKTAAITVQTCKEDKRTNFRIKGEVKFERNGVKNTGTK